MKKMAIGVFSALMVTACYYDNEEALYGVEVCSTGAVTYGEVSGIIGENCIACHSQAANSGGIALETYTQVKAQASNGKLNGVITHSNGFSPMPKNAAKLSECEITRIQQWINEGALNN